MRLIKLFLTAILLLATCFPAAAQEKFDDKAKAGKKENPTAVAKATPRVLTKGEGIAESSVFVYSRLRGRAGLAQIRKTTVEIGKIKTTNPDGTIVTSEYEMRILRGESLAKERVSLKQKLPNAEYSLVYDGARIFGLYNNSVFAPNEEAIQTFENRHWHGIECLLRYFENGSTIEYLKEDKIMGVNLHIVDVKDAAGRSTRFFVSRKSLRIMWLTFEEKGVKFRRKFYDYRYSQDTLVPYRSVLWADDKILEEQSISTITFGQPLDEEMFKAPEAPSPASF